MLRERTLVTLGLALRALTIIGVTVGVGFVLSGCTQGGPGGGITASMSSAEAHCQQYGTHAEQTGMMNMAITFRCSNTATLAAAAQQAAQQEETDYAACKKNFSESNKDAVARAKCFNEADSKFARSSRYPDLINLIIAKRTELAERRAAGKITYAQAQLELSQQVSQVISEGQRRDAANNAVAAQQNAVAAQQRANDNMATLMLLQTMQANRPAPYMIPTSPTLNTNCQTYGTNTSCQVA
jgi:hypothetical protein